MTRNVQALRPGTVVLLDAESANLGFARGDRATVVQVEQDRHVTCLLERTGQRLAFSPDELILVPAYDAGYVTTAAALLICLFGALLFLALLTVGQHAMCATHRDSQGQPTISYCDGYRPVSR